MGTFKEHLICTTWHWKMGKQRNKEFVADCWGHATHFLLLPKIHELALFVLRLCHTISWDQILEFCWSGGSKEQGNAGICVVIVTSDGFFRSLTLTDMRAGLDRVANRTREVKLAYSWGSELEIWRGFGEEICKWKEKSWVNQLTIFPVNIWGRRLPRNDTEIKKGCRKNSTAKGQDIQLTLWWMSWWLWLVAEWQLSDGHG